MMIGNALWNLMFFRARNLFVAFITGSAAPILDVALLLCLLRLDAPAALALVPYLVYRVYAVWWGYALWIANR
jgi:tryptophan-rich sensory protein